MNTKPILRATVAAALLAAMVSCFGCDLMKTDTYRFLSPQEVIRPPEGNPVTNILTSYSPVDQYEEILPNASFPRPSDLVYDETDYVLGPGDVVSVSVLDLLVEGGEVAVQREISESGYIDLLYLDEPILAAGKTRRGLRQTIIEAYVDANILKRGRANVNVSILVRRKSVFSILGAVARPGVYQVTRRDMRLLEALSMAGDVAQANLRYMYVIRHPSPARQRFRNGEAEGPAPRRDAEPPDTTEEGLERLRRALEDGADAAMPGVIRMSDGGSPTAETDPGELQGDGGWQRTGRGWSRSNGQTDAAQDNGMNGMKMPNGEMPDTEDGNTFGFPKSAIRGTQPRVIAINIDRLRAGDELMNIVIRDNDVIQVTPLEVGEFYITGHVNRPGVYSLTGRRITVKQAVAAAGGFDPVAFPPNSVLIRRIGDTQEQTFPLDLEKIWQGEEPDLYLKPDDVIAVGTHWSASFLAVMRNAFRMTYGFGFIYDRNFAEPLDLLGEGHDSSRFKRW